MSTPFPEQVAPGGILVFPQIQSPGFVTGVSGWRIARDGSAEFNSITIPPGSGGNRVFAQGTAPASPNTGDLWINTSSGNQVSVWNGSAWTPYQWGTSAIASGSITAALIAANTITAAQLAAGIVYAGIVNGTTITGASIVADGSNGEILVYSGTPAAGNLIMSMSGAAGSDSHGNSYPEGLKVFGTSGGSVVIDPSANSGVPYIYLFPKGATHILNPPQVFGGVANPGAANEIEEAILLSGQTAANTNAALQLFSDAADGSAKAYANFVIDGVNTILRNLTGGYIPVTQTATGTFTNANAGAQFMAGITIPANDAQAGTVYEIEFPFNGTFENQTLGFKPYLGSTAVATSGGDTIGPGFFPSGTGFQGTVRLKVQVLTTGSSGTVNWFIDGGIGNNGTRASGTNAEATYLSSQNSGYTFDTTVAQTINIASVWGGSTAGQTITARGFKFTRSGP